MSVVDGNEYHGDQFRMGIRSEPNKRIRKSPRNLLFLSRRGRTRGSIDRRYSVPERRKDMRKFRSRKLLTRTRRGQRFQLPTHLPSFIEMSGLRLPLPRYEQDEREVGHPRHPS